MANEEYIERNSLLEEVKQIKGAFAAPLIIRKIKEVKAEDVVAVVRCKNCEYYEVGGRCTFDGDRWHSPDYFCSCGERKEGTLNDN